jgi:hypothetical protein
LLILEIVLLVHEVLQHLFHVATLRGTLVGVLVRPFLVSVGITLVLVGITLVLVGGVIVGPPFEIGMVPPIVRVISI